MSKIDKALTGKLTVDGNEYNWKLGKTEILELQYKDGHIEKMTVRMLEVFCDDKKLILVQGGHICHKFPLAIELSFDFLESDETKAEVLRTFLRTREVSIENDL